MLSKIFTYRKIGLSEARRIVAASYFGMLRRPPEKVSIDETAKALSAGNMRCVDFLEGIISSEEFRSNNNFQTDPSLSRLHPDLFFENRSKHSEIKRIIYFCFGNEKPIGGVKVIIQHAQIINNLENSEIIAEIFFPEYLDFTPDWFNFDCNIKRDAIFDCSTDFIIIPEMWALLYGKLLKEAGIRYGIFVQNGYLIFHELNKNNYNELNDLCDIYLSSKVIVSISDDIDQCLITIFPKIESKLVRVSLSVNTQLFFPRKQKINQIAYMPRKLRYHSRWLVNALTMHLGSEWTILPIEGRSEAEVAQILGVSKIFLSFSDQEGFALPPLEAALSGNKVIGYTGEAAKEYFKGELFVEIDNGNLLRFLDAVVAETKLFSGDSRSFLDQDEVKNQIHSLKARYSREKEISHLKNLMDFIS